jgi:hypothetical protein
MTFFYIFTPMDNLSIEKFTEIVKREFQSEIQSKILRVDSVVVPKGVFIIKMKVAVSTTARLKKNIDGLNHSIDVLNEFNEDEILIVDLKLIDSSEYFILLFNVSGEKYLCGMHYFPTGAFHL